MAPYRTEKELFNKTLDTQFLREIHGDDNCIKLVEPKGLFGIPDLLIVKSGKTKGKKLTTTSFEMKLRNWKRALIQAIKYKAFSNYAYVVVDHYYASPAIKNIERFKAANVGLVSIEHSGKVHKHFRPTKETPYCRSISGKLEDMVVLHMSEDTRQE